MGSLFSSNSPSIPQSDPVPTRADPSIAARIKQLRVAENQRRGRSASRLVKKSGSALGDAPVDQPSLGGNLLGQ